MCVGCVCVCERERDGVLVCVCVCERERDGVLVCVCGGCACVHVCVCVTGSSVADVI